MLALGTHSQVHGRNADPARHMVGLTTDDITADWKRLKDAGIPTAIWSSFSSSTARADPSSETKEGDMGAKAESLARQFEQKAQEATKVFDGLSDADWKKLTSAEKWSVGVVAHHVAASHEGIGGIVKTISSGQAMPHFTMQMLDAMNAKHAQEHAGCTKAETLALHKKNAAAAASQVRGLDDTVLTKTGTVLAGMPAMSVEQIITGILISHVDEHLGSIRATVGH